jgi:hypothetical protein
VTASENTLWLMNQFTDSDLLSNLRRNFEIPCLDSLVNKQFDLERHTLSRHLSSLDCHDSEASLADFYIPGQ